MVVALFAREIVSKATPTVIKRIITINGVLLEKRLDFFTCDTFIFNLNTFSIPNVTQRATWSIVNHQA